MSSQLKLGEIESLQPTQIADVNRLLELSIDLDPEVRFRAIERLRGCKDAHVVTRVREALRDSDELVRVVSLEFLRESRDTAAFELIRTCLGDPDRLVRIYAVLAIGRFGDGAIISELELRSVGTSDEEKAAYFSALFQLGRAEYFEKLLGLLGSESYRARCMVANLLAGHDLDKKCKSRIVRILREALSEESIMAVRSSIEDAIAEILVEPPAGPK